MSATAFLVARRGDDWSLEATGIPVAVRREFKRISTQRDSAGVQEMLYFDTYGQTKRKRFKPSLLEVPVIADDTDDDLPTLPTKKRR